MSLVIEYGDLLAVQGKSWYSDAIRKATGDGPYSHIGVVVAVQPFVIITEAVDRVRTRPLDVSVKDAVHAWILKPPLTEMQRIIAVEKALSFDGDDYGWWDIALQGLDAAARTKWFAEHFAEIKHPICSMLADLAEPEFGLDPKSVTPNDYAKFDWPKLQLN